MKNCPACKKESSSATECTHCGIYFAKWEALHSGDAPGAASSASPLGMISPEPATERRSPWVPLMMVVLLAGGAGFWFFQKGRDEQKAREAFAEFRKTLASGNVTAVKGLVSAQYAKEFEETGSEMKIQLVSAMVPKQLEIEKVEVKGNEAIVTTKATEDGAAVTGTTRFVKEGGAWKVAKEDWNINLSDASFGDAPAPELSLDPDFPAQTTAQLAEVAKLAVGPNGLAVSGGEIVTASRDKPWGFLRIGLDGKDQKNVKIVSSIGQSEVGFDHVIWNGKDYVSMTQPGWYAPVGDRLINLHDAATLEPIRHFRAPPRVGCLAWDGSGYWAASRQNTETSGEGQFIYKLDHQFKIVRTLDSPAKGCQGLAWVAGHLWLADVFSDKIYVVNVDGPQAHTVRTYDTPVNYLSGLALSGNDILLAEYGEKKLWKLKNSGLIEGEMTASIPRESGSPAQPRAETPAASASPAQSNYQSPWDREYAEKYGTSDVAQLVSAFRIETFHKERLLNDLITRGAKDQAVRTLNEMLRSRDSRNSADPQVKTLLAKAGAPVSLDWEKDDDPTSESDMSLMEWEIEMVGNTLFSNGRLYLGRDIVDGYSRAPMSAMTIPTFARYRFTIEGGSLASPVEKTIEAERRPGEHSWASVALASGLGPGNYRVSMFLHAQTYGPDGTPKSINNSRDSLRVELK